jgi:ADP-ribose pyrophosphatase YjhB (NUDIX family)
MDLQVGVKVLLKNKEGKFLLLRRNPKKYPEVGPKWDIVGGRIEPGTTLMENLKREVFEETKLELLSEPKLVAAQDILKVADRHVVRLTYISNIDGDPKLDGDHMDAGWFTADEIKEMDVGVLDSYFKELVDRGMVIF